MTGVIDCAGKLVALQNTNSLFIKLFDSLMHATRFNELPVQPFFEFAAPCPCYWQWHHYFITWIHLRLTCEFFSVSISLLDKYPTLTWFKIQRTPARYYRQTHLDMCTNSYKVLFALYCPLLENNQSLSLKSLFLHAKQQKVKYLIQMTNVGVSFVCIVKCKCFSLPHTACGGLWLIPRHATVTDHHDCFCWVLLLALWKEKDVVQL